MDFECRNQNALESNRAARREADPTRVLSRLRPKALLRGALRLAPFAALPAGLAIALQVEVAEAREWSSDLPVAQAQAALATMSGGDGLEAAHFRISSPRITIDARVREYAAPSFEPDRPIIEALRDLTSRIHRDFGFDPDATTVTSTIDDLFESGAGVCQDFAHLGVGCLRSQGIPARYVSGYLETDPPPGREKLVGADVSHAWVSARLPGIGWVDLDPTNNQFINGRYVTTGWGRDYSDVSPLKGVVYSDGGTTTLDVSVDVRRID